MKNFNLTQYKASTLVAPTIRPQPVSITCLPGPKINLLGGYSVIVDFYELIQKQAEEGMQTLERGKLYKCSEICGDGFWRKLTNSEKRLAGRCFAHMVYMGIFLLSFVQYKRSPTKRYRLI